MSGFLAVTALPSGGENRRGNPDEALTEDRGFIFSTRQFLSIGSFEALPEMSRPQIHLKHDLNFKGVGGKDV